MMVERFFKAGVLKKTEVHRAEGLGFGQARARIIVPVVGGEEKRE